MCLCVCVCVCVCVCDADGAHQTSRGREEGSSLCHVPLAKDFPIQEAGLGKAIIMNHY